MFIEKKIHSPNKIIHSQKGSLNKERMIEMIRKSSFLLLVVVLCLSLITPASAQIGHIKEAKRSNILLALEMVGI